MVVKVVGVVLGVLVEVKIAPEVVPVGETATGLAPEVVAPAVAVVTIPLSKSITVLPSTTNVPVEKGMGLQTCISYISVNAWRQISYRRNRRGGAGAKGVGIVGPALVGARGGIVEGADIV